jgi:hypothetical protein
MRHLILLAAIVLGGCTETHTPSEPMSRQDERVSIIQVLANPKEFDGKKVRLIGYLHFEFESYALWLHREDHVHGLPNRIDIDANACADKVDQVNDQYVLLEGTFLILNKGTAQKRHILMDITRCQRWAEPR